VILTVTRWMSSCAETCTPRMVYCTVTVDDPDAASIRSNPAVFNAPWVWTVAPFPFCHRNAPPAGTPTACNWNCGAVGEPSKARAAIGAS